MRRTLPSVLVLTALVVLQSVLAVGPAAAKKRLIYSVKEARAYAVKASLAKEVIEAVPKCDPKADPYNCAEYNHKRNCPKKIAIGPNGKLPQPTAPAGAEPTKGKSGAGEDATEPPESSPVRINRFLSLAKLTHIFDVKEAGGLASSLFTDLSGRNEPEAHTESEAYGNKASFEERCYWNDGSEGDESGYEHFLSTSSKELGTYHLAECVGRQCQFGAGVNAERARSIVQLVEKKGKLTGSLRSSVDGISFADGLFTVDSVATFASFESDGTADGVKWSVWSAASGAKLAGQPVPLPPGETLEGPNFTAGVAEPYVSVPKDGRTLTMIAPGLHFGSEQQSVFFGGAEVRASMGKDTPFVFEPDIPESDPGDPESPSGGDDPAPISGGTGGSTGTSGSIDLGGGGPAGADAGPEDSAVPVGLTNPGVTLLFEKATGIGAVPSLVALGLLCWMLLLARWLQRYSWGRRMTRYQPFRFVDWMYRAFVKT
jgi:hypothetical protein